MVGVLCLRIPRQMNKPFWMFRSLNPVSCLHSTNSSGPLRCTTPYYRSPCRYIIGVHAIVCPTTPPTGTRRTLRMKAITRPCSLSYFWSSPSISGNNLLWTAVREYISGIFVQEEGTIVAVLPRTNIYWGFRFLAEPCLGWFHAIFVPVTNTQCAVTFLASLLTYETLHLYVCSRIVRLIYSNRPTTRGARRQAVLLC